MICAFTLHVLPTFLPPPLFPTDFISLFSPSRNIAIPRLVSLLLRASFLPYTRPTTPFNLFLLPPFFLLLIVRFVPTKGMLHVLYRGQGEIP